MDTDKTELIPVPLPSEIPTPPSLDGLPSHVIHSATVEMLIQQNEDLSSRLKVNIRRNSSLEQQIQKLTEDAAELERKNQVLESQNQIVKEKQAIWTQQKQDKDKKLERHDEEMELMELRYNELYTTSQQTQRDLRNQLAQKENFIKNLRRKLINSRKVSARAKDRLRDFLIQVGESLGKKEKQIQTLNAQSRRTLKKFEDLHNETLQKENNFREQLEAYNQKSQFSLEKLKLETAELKDALVCKEAEASSIKADLEQMFQSLQTEKQNRHKLSQLSKEVTELRNRHIVQSKEFREERTKLDDARLEAERMMKDSQKTAKDLTKQLEESKSALQACESRLVEMSRDNKELDSQLETLKELWTQTQDKLEKEELKRKTLERINRELSRSDKSDRVDRSVERAQASDSKGSAPPLAEVYGPQFTPIGKGPDLEV